MTEHQREGKNSNRMVEWQSQKKKVMKAKLIKRLQENGVTTTQNINNIQKLATSRGIPIEEEIPKIIEGWAGKPKGMLQILWECGFINRNNLNQYTIDGRKDAFGIL